MNRKLVVIAGAAILMLFAAFAVRLGTGGIGAGPSQSEAPGTVAVEVREVERSTMTQTVSSVGTVEAMMDVNVESETAGRVVGVHFDAGDRVSKGQTLVTVDDELKAVAVAQAKSQALAAETQAKKTARDLERAETLYKTQDVSDAELEGYRLGARAAEAQHQAALAGLTAADRALSDTRIKAPIAGYVAAKMVETGEMVRSGKVVANIVDLSRVKVKLSIPENDVVKLRRGQSAVMELDSRPGERFSGRVLNVGAKTESPTGHTFPVEILIENGAERGIKAGMFASVDITAAVVSDAITIPREWVMSEDSNPTVFVVRDGRARATRVSLGSVSGTSVQVLGGLREGDLVVSFGQKELADGTPVRYQR